MMTRLFDAFGMPKSHPGHQLGRELILVLLVKLTVIALAAVFIFGPNQRPRIDTAKVEAHLIGAALPASPLATSNSKTSASKAPASRSKIP